MCEWKIRLAPVEYSNSNIFKTFEIFKTSSKDCLEWSNKDGKALSKMLSTK